MFTLMPRKEKFGKGAPARLEPYPFNLLRREFASLFDRAFPVWPFEPAWETEPWGFEVEEREHEVVVYAELPGFEMKEIEVTLRGYELTVLAEHKEPIKPEVAKYRNARMERTVTLPVGIKPEKIEATYRNGVLEMHVPLTPEAKPRHIEVKT